MQKIKLFKSIESELRAVEEEMNSWIEETGARVSSSLSWAGASLKNSATLRSSAVATLLSAVRPMEEMPLSTCERNPIESPEWVARPRSVTALLAELPHPGSDGVVAVRFRTAPTLRCAHLRLPSVERRGRLFAVAEHIS